MTDKELICDTLRRMGKTIAQSVQEKAETLTGTELNAEGDYIPSFKAACAKKNMLDRPVGFVCKSSAGRVVKLLQPYDSMVYTGEPEELPAQFGFVWSDDPAHALPFVAISTSPFMKGNCCTDEGEVYRSTIDNNVWKPSEYSDGWEKVWPASE